MPTDQRVASAIGTFSVLTAIGIGLVSNSVGWGILGLVGGVFLFSAFFTFGDRI